MQTLCHSSYFRVLKGFSIALSCKQISENLFLTRLTDLFYLFIFLLIFVSPDS